MSIASARAAMTQLVTTERDASIVAPSDDWTAAPSESTWQTHLTAIPCRAWLSAGREIADADKTVVVEDMRLIVPLGTDVTERDRLASITDRLGVVLVTGPIGIRAVMYERDYLELVLVRLS